MPVSNLYPVKIRWKSIRIEDRISTRFRKGPNVNQQTNSRLLQHIQKVVEAAVRMTDGGKARCHQSIFFRTFSLCAATWSVLPLLISYCGSSFDAVSYTHLTLPT